MNDKKEKILIVGLGLLGGSYAEALTAKGFEVGAVTRRQQSIDYAVDKGIIAHGTIAPDADYLSQFDLVVLSLYPAAVVEWVKTYSPCLKQNALITDVTGVKCSVVYEIQQLLRRDLEFVGAHPMAGREVSGVQNADAAIFKGANYIVTPTEKNSESAVSRVEQLGRDVGCAKISRLSPDEHDEMIGFLSQLTHCIAVALMTCRDTHRLADYTGDSFRDLTRIAKINEDMWSELFLANKEKLLMQMDCFAEKLGEIRGAIACGDEDRLKELMRLSTERRTIFDKDKNKPEDKKS